jgi:hypothetical protein
MKVTKNKKVIRKDTPTYVLDVPFLAAQVDAVAIIMWALAEQMEYYSGFNEELKRYSRDMAKASVTAGAWARAISRFSHITPTPRGTLSSKRKV